MGYERTLNAEINAELDRLASEKQRWVAAWITQAIVARHEANLPEGDEGLFWRHCGYATTRDAVRRQINIRAEDKEEKDDRQAILPGYQHVHAYYIVNRRGVGDIGLPIELMTDREIDEKIARYESMSTACRDHADELRDYKNLRRAQKRRRRGHAND